MGDENRLTRNRASRSRSKTPFLRSSCDRVVCSGEEGIAHSGNNHLHVQYQKSFSAVAESQDERKNQSFSVLYKDTVLGSVSITGAVKFPRKGKRASTVSVIPENKIINTTKINGVYQKPGEVNTGSFGVKDLSKSVTDTKTSDYSSEEGENIQQEAHRAFQLYKDTGDWWNVFPKTDYTYSEYSPHRREIVPGIVNMPNMSRLGLRNAETTSRHEYFQQNLKNVDISRHSSFSRTGENSCDEKWARVLGAEYANKQAVHPYQERSLWQTTCSYTTRVITSVLSFISWLFLWCERSTSSRRTSSHSQENKFISSSSASSKAKLLQWIYCLLGYVKFVDTWLLMGWSSDDVSTHAYSYEGRSHSLWSKLLKFFFLISPVLFVAGCWAYIQFWDDQDVSNSVSIPEPNQPLLTSNLKIASDSVAQVNGDYSLVKFLCGGFASNIPIVWSWLPKPWLFFKREQKVVERNGDIFIPIPTFESSEQVKIVEECSPAKINMDELASKIIMNPQFINLISPTSSENVEAKLKIEINNIISKINLLEQYHVEQKSQSILDLESVKGMIKAEIALSIDGISKSNAEFEERILKKISKMNIDQQSQLSQLQKLDLDINGILNQIKLLKIQVEEESSSRESSIISLAGDLRKLKEEYSTQLPIMTSERVASYKENWNFDESKLKQIVADALMLYDADKTGRADYALESSGGSIVSTRCTETYQAKTAVLSLFGFNLWYTSNNPRKIIQPGVHPGECWAFKGSQGYVVIKLSSKIYINMFSLEHIPTVLSPVGTIDSAPKDFSVWGLNNDTDTEGELIGQFMYDQNGTSLQSFPVEKLGLPPFQFIELRIESNHGNLEYTCIYRFRVHGVVNKQKIEDLQKHED